jgi:hypothetical protein
MPDLNLIDDDGLSEEMPEGAEEVIDAGGGGGGAMKMVLIIIIVLIVLLGGVYLLNSMGIVNLWGNNQPPVMAVEEQFPEEFYDDAAFADQPVDTSWMSEELPDDVALLETTPFDDPGAADANDADMASQVEMLPFEEDPVDVPQGAPQPESEALSQMKGDFTVQVVAYREKEKADNILSNLEFAGYPAFIEMVPMKGGDWYTGRVGKYATRAAAKEAVQSFAAELRENYFIDKIRSQ